MSKLLNVLIIENDDNDYELLLLNLRAAGYNLIELARVQTEEEFKHELGNKKWDIILSDYSLPRFSAPIALTILKQSGLDIPFVIISGTIGEERAASTLRAGARDFVSKYDLSRLIPVIERELRELSSRKLKQKVEKAFQASEQRYKLIVNTAREGIFMLDDTGTITFANKESSSLLGLHEQEILKNNIKDFIVIGDDDPAGNIMGWLTRHDSGQRTLRFRNSADAEWWGIANVSILPSVDEAHKNYLLMVTDVSEQVKSRHMIEALVDDLKSALKARDEFLSIASHELKTPLTSLLIQAQQQRRLISKGDESAFEKLRVQKIAEQTEKLSLRLSRLVDDMLDISRIRSGNLTIVKEETELRKILNDVIQRLATQFEKSGNSLPEVDAEVIHGLWDVTRLEQVITNLLTNSMKYGEGKPVKISLKKNGEMAELIVEDKGIGIELSAQERIFDRFERAINPNDVSGLGLGLFITREIIKSHDGRIWVESLPGKGSKFIVQLPLKALDV